MSRQPTEAPIPSTSYSSKISPLTSTPIMRPGSSSTSSNSESGSSPHLSIRARRVRAAQSQGHFPPELVNPIPPLTRPRLESSSRGLRSSKTESNIADMVSQPSTSQFLYTPGVSLRLGALDHRKPSTLASIDTTGPGRSSDDFRLIRKKSGELVKPSLKSTRRSTTDGLSKFSSKSEPATPLCKAVHFDSQLEHVKLFLAEQKPLAVSRDGSPTEDTSGTDSDFPSFIFGRDEDSKRRRMKLVIRAVNMPSRINMVADVCLEEVSVSPGNNAVLGRVRLRNIAYVKTLVVRFTFDSWQTTSEVVGHYHDSPSWDFDRFSFTIKLDDLLARIEEKTLVLAVRYSVAGQDFWDNNSGQNYIVKFSVSTPRDRSLSDEDSSENLVTLQTKLEKVSQTKDRTGPAFSTSLVRSPEPEESSFKSTSSLASRYDFNTSLKNLWQFNNSPPTHQRNNSYPPFSMSDKAASLRSPPPLGSPRDLMDGMPVTSDIIDDASLESPQGHGRKHHRGHFEASLFGAANVRRTPPTSPPPRSPEVLSPLPGLTSPESFGESSFYSFPEAARSSFSLPLSPELPPHRPPPLISGLFSETSMNTMGFDDGELSTPSLTTPNSSRSTTPSPTEQFLSLPLVSDSDDQTSREPGSYRELINQ